MASTRNFSMQSALDISVINLETGVLEAYLEDCLTTNIELTTEKVYSMGKGGSYITGFSHSKRIPVTIKQGYLTSEVLAIQSGQDIIVGTNTNVMKFERLTVTSDVAETSFVALGEAGSEIGSLWTMSGNSFDTKLTQSGTVGAGLFTVAGKNITFNTSELSDNTVILVAYNYTADSTAQTIKFDTDVFAGSKKVVMTGLAVDNCNGKQYKAQLIFRKMDISDSMNLNLEETGDVAVMDVKMETLASCSANTTMEWVLFDEDLAV